MIETDTSTPPSAGKPESYSNNLSSASSSSASSSVSAPSSNADVAAASVEPNNSADLTSKLILFEADDKRCSFETDRHPNVTVVGSTGRHDHGSSKVKLKSIVDYKWDLRHYPGRLITVHIDGKHIAYVIVVRSNEGMVRVVNPSNGNRALIKGMSTEVLDLQFAHIRSQMLLAAIEHGALHLHRIESLAGKIVCTALLKIVDTSPLAAEPSAAGLAAASAALHRISWCPYVPERETDIDEYVSQQLVWVRGQNFACYSMRSVLDRHGSGCTLDAAEVDGTLSNSETTNITGASFSPDGTTLCVSADDGVIRFYQVYFHTNEPNPRCLHQWTPHGGKPISAFFFLDNLTMYSKDKSLWRHAITASDNNAEIKVWCCSTWECLQTVTFTSANLSTVQLSAQIDRTSSYLVLTDSKHRGLYVLQVQIDAGGSPPRNHAETLLGAGGADRCRSATRAASLAICGETDVVTDDNAATSVTSGGGDAANAVKEPKAAATSTGSQNGSLVESAASASSSLQRSFAYIKSISEFPLSSPILSCHIVDAAVRRYKCAFNDSYLLEELDDYDEENHSLYCVVINMYLVQPKSVQECHVLYQPTVANDALVLSSLENVSATSSSMASTASNVDGLCGNESMAYRSLLSLQQSSSAGDDEVASTAADGKQNGNSAPVASADSSVALIANTSHNASAVETAAPAKITLEQLMVQTTPQPQIETGSNSNQSATTATPVAVSNVSALLSRSPGTINLMTPDSFSSPRSATSSTAAAAAAAAATANDDVSSDVRSALQMLALSARPSHDAAKVAETVAAVAVALAGGAATTQATIQSSDGGRRQSADVLNQILAPECGASLLAAAVAAASGGSSPSREVQEILSPKDSDVINDFFDDSTDLSDDNDVEVPPPPTTKNNLDEQYNFDKSNSKESNDTKTSSLGKGGAWPKVPVVPPLSMTNIHCPSYNNANSTDVTVPPPPTSSSVDATDAPTLAASSAEATAAAMAAAVAATATTNAAIGNLDTKMDKLLEFMQAQARQIAELRTAASVERKRHADATALAAQQLEKRLAKMQDEMAVRAKREHGQRLEEFKKTQIASNLEFRTHIVQSVTQVVGAQVSERITGLLMAELQQRIVPVIVSRLDQIKHQMQTDVAHKLSVCDQLLRDNIAKACSNKSTLEVFGNAVMLGVQASVQKTYGDTVRTTLIPAYEKASGELFKQVAEVFVNGTKAYSKLFENYFAQYEPVQENLNALVANLPEQLKQSSDVAMQTYTAKMAVDMQRDLKVMQAHLVQTVRDNIKHEIKKGFEAQTATIEDSVRSVVRSQSQTPAPSVYDVQEQIKALLSQNQVNNAFHQALVANDLNLVEFTIEKADYASVFNPCPLQQTVLLSLIQQISADMTNHNELKQRYMAEAILNLNMRDPTTKEHAPKMLRELVQHCQAYTIANPSSQHNSGLRMLMMAVQGLGIKLF